MLALPPIVLVLVVVLRPRRRRRPRPRSFFGCYASNTRRLHSPFIPLPSWHTDSISNRGRRRPRGRGEGEDEDEHDCEKDRNLPRRGCSPSISARGSAPTV